MALLSHRQGWSLAVLLIFPCLFFAQATGDSPSATFRTGTSEVRVTFFTTDENNRLVENITQDDFAVVDNGLVIRNFRSLARTSETTLNVVLLIDTSDSVQPHFQQTQRDILRFLSDDRPNLPGENLSVITFAGLQPQLACAGDCRAPDKQERLISLRSAGMTPLYDSLVFASRFLSHRPTRAMRQVLILFSDGNDNVSIASARDALDKVISSGALLYTVNPERSQTFTHGGRILQQMADATGARSFSLCDDTVDLLTEILADLHASYVVTYQLPTRLPGFHSLSLLPKHNLNLRFHSPRGYFYDETE